MRYTGSLEGGRTVNHYLKVKGETNCKAVTFKTILVSFLRVLRLKVRGMPVVLDPLGRV